MTNGERSYFDPLVLARLSNLYLRARWVVEGIMSGIHRSRSKGFSVEFEEHREDRKSTRLNSSHIQKSRMPSSA